MKSATSFTMGAETRKENVAPSGTPTRTKPMKSGTAEQEQKGVKMPRSEASRLLQAPARLARMSRVRSGLTKVWMKVTPRTTRASSISTLGES